MSSPGPPCESCPDPWADMGPPIECEPLKAVMTLKGCLANQEMAERALALLDEGVSIYLLPAPDLDRLMACGNCPLFTGEGIEGAIDLLRQAVRGLIELVELMEWHRRDPEIQEGKKRAREKRKSERRRDDRALERKLRHIRDRYGRGD